MVIEIDNIIAIFSLFISVCTIYLLYTGLRNWKIDKSKEFYQSLQKEKASLLKKLKKINKKNIDEDAISYAMSEFLGNLEVIAIMYFMNCINKKLFKEIFFSLFEEMYQREDIQKIIKEDRIHDKTAYENFEKIYLEIIYKKDTKYTTIRDIVLSIIFCIGLSVIYHAYIKYIT